PGSLRLSARQPSCSSEVRSAADSAGGSADAAPEPARSNLTPTTTSNPATNRAPRRTLLTAPIRSTAGDATGGVPGCAGVGSSSPAGETAASRPPLGVLTRGVPGNIPRRRPGQTGNRSSWGDSWLFPGDSSAFLKAPAPGAERSDVLPPSPGQEAVVARFGFETGRNKQNGTGANGSPTGSNQPGGSAAGQPAPFLQSRRNQIILGVLLLGILLALPLFGMSQPATNERPLSDVLAAIPTGQFNGQQITQARIDDDNRVLDLTLANGKDITASYPNEYGTVLVKDLTDAKVPFDTEPVHHASPIGGVVAMLLPVLLIIGFFVWMSKKGPMGAGAANAKAFTATKAELPEPPAARFADVVGCDEAVEELSEIVSFLHDPSHFDAAGAKMPRGFLLVGPPGTGKTLLAR